MTTTTHTANLDTFAYSRYPAFGFDSMAEVDGLLVGVDDTGFFVLDGVDDDGVDFAASVTTGWTDFAGLGDPSIPTDTEKRLRALYAGVTGTGALTLTAATERGEDSGALALEGLATGGAFPLPLRVVPPQGLTARWWKFTVASTGPGAWTFASLNVAWERLTRRR